jgi:hypothetical protein
MPSNYRKVTKKAFVEHAVKNGLVWIASGTRIRPSILLTKLESCPLSAAEVDETLRCPVRARSFGIERKQENGSWSRLDLGKYTTIYETNGFYFVYDQYDGPGSPGSVRVYA